MVFCDRDWVQFGTKQELVSDLSEVTGIEKNILRNVDLLSAAHVGKKMSWAASRKTTRIEDQAYCLLGIFDVNMPLLYGEGDKAFLRLQEEIARSRNDLTLFAWRHDLRQPHGLEFRGIFAVSPAEFRHCSQLGVSEEPLQQDVEFSLTNRGLRISSNIYDSNSSDLTLALDCLEYMDFLPTMGMWIHIYLKRIGSRYVRAKPQIFHYTQTRQQQQQRHRGTDGYAIYIAPTIPSFVARTMSSRLSVNLVYSQDLRDQVQQQDVSHGRVLRSTDFDRHHVVIIPPELLRHHECVLEDVPRVWHVDLDRDLYTVTRFISQGLQTDQFCHLFPFQLGRRAPAVQIALVCGLSSINPGGSGPGNPRFPWATLLNETHLAKLFIRLDDSSATVISHEHKTRLLHRYIFEQYSDGAGSLRLGDLPTSTHIKDYKRRLFFTITVKIVVGLQSRNGFSIMLSSSKWTTS